jgi:hypothetical protein
MMHRLRAVPVCLWVASAGSAESIILSAGGTESIILSAGSGESMMLSDTLSAALFGHVITQQRQLQKQQQSRILTIAD